MLSETSKWKFRIQHILNAIAESRDFIGTMTYESFCTDAKTLKAVVWNLTVIGEAARHVPAHVEAAFPEIPWPQLRGMRNHIVHAYDRIDWETVWEVIQDELPPLVAIFERILQEVPE